MDQQEVEMEINNISFMRFCSELEGVRVFNKSGFEVFKYQLFFKGIDPLALVRRQTKYSIRPR